MLINVDMIGFPVYCVPPGSVSNHSLVRVVHPAQPDTVRPVQECPEDAQRARVNVKTDTQTHGRQTTQDIQKDGHDTERLDREEVSSAASWLHISSLINAKIVSGDATI